MNNRILLIILLVLLGIYGLTRIFSNKRERSFKAELIAVDSSRISSIVIEPKSGEGAITLNREDDQWIASRGEQHVRAQPNIVQSILTSLSEIKTRRIAANDPEKWPEYEVEEGAGTRVQVFEEGEPVEDFIIGRFSFNQQSRSATSFIRLAGEDEVYAVDGFLAMSFNQSFDAFRNKTVVKMKREMEVTEFAYEFPDTSYQFARTPAGWMMEGDRLLDSMAVENYLNVLRNLTGENFADDFDDSRAAVLEKSTLTIRGNNMPAPFVVEVFRDTTRETSFVVRSNYNKDTYFASDSTGLYAKIFKPYREFLPPNPG